MATKKDAKAKTGRKGPGKVRPAKAPKPRKAGGAAAKKNRPAPRRAIARASPRRAPQAARSAQKGKPVSGRKAGGGVEAAVERAAPARPPLVAVGPANATVFKLSPAPGDETAVSELTIPAEARRRMAHIDDASMAKIVAKLDEMRLESQAVVRQQVSSDLEQQKEVTDVGDDLDQAVTERNREFNLIMHQRHLRRLLQVQEAFARLQEGTFGFCEGTDEPINPKRLVIMPLARFSLEYQEQQEKMLGRSPEEILGGEESFVAEE